MTRAHSHWNSENRARRRAERQAEQAASRVRLEGFVDEHRQKLEADAVASPPNQGRDQLDAYFASSEQTRGWFAAVGIRPPDERATATA